jgi:hypothetical protein
VVLPAGLAHPPRLLVLRRSAASHVASDNGRKSPLPKSTQQGNQGTRSLIPPGLCNTVLEVNALVGRVA